MRIHNICFMVVLLLTSFAHADEFVVHATWPIDGKLTDMSCKLTADPNAAKNYVEITSDVRGTEKYPVDLKVCQKIFNQIDSARSCTQIPISVMVVSKYIPGKEGFTEEITDVEIHKTINDCN